MKIKFRFFSLVLCLMLLFSATASAGFEFSDDRFVGDFTTENLDRIIEEYELYDGWYWTTRPYVTQTFHALEDTPGWTSTAVNVYERKRYEQGYYGCRWNANIVIPEHPDLGWGVYLAAGRFGATGLLCNFLAAAAISLYAEIMARIRKFPSFSYLVIEVARVILFAAVFYVLNSFLHFSFIIFQYNVHERQPIPDIIQVYTPLRCFILYHSASASPLINAMISA